ncbi:MAG: cation transporter [bacterium]
MENLEIQINGMNCNHCVKAVEIELKKLELNSSKVEIGNAAVEFNPLLVKKEDIYSAIEEAGFSPVK